MHEQMRKSNNDIENLFFTQIKSLENNRWVKMQRTRKKVFSVILPLFLSPSWVLTASKTRWNRQMCTLNNTHGSLNFQQIGIDTFRATIIEITYKCYHLTDGVTILMLGCEQIICLALFIIYSLQAKFMIYSY